MQKRGIVQIDCPVSGGVAGAEKGTLAVMTSGPKEDVEQLRPALEVFGKVFYCGDRPGLAQSMKLANNFLSATGMAASSEAIAMGVKAGLDPSLMCDVINAGSGMNTATTQKFPRAVLPGTFDYGFGMALMVKDVRLFLAEAEDFGIPVEVAKAVGSMWEAAMKEHGERSDFTELAKTVEKRAGVQMRAKKK
jgi:3-hydroxyisobutyrate dehydrogenase-like beta-hydroxyacid dehydrogenase